MATIRANGRGECGADRHSRENADGREPSDRTGSLERAARARRAQRRRGGAARGALRRRSRPVAHLHPPQDQGLRGARRGGARPHRERMPTPCWRRSASIFRDDAGGAGSCGRRPAPTSRASACISRAGLPRSLLKTAPPVFTQHARNPERSVADRRQRHGVRAGLRPALRARPRRQAPLRHDRGFPQFREARLYGAVDPPFGRHGVRAGRRAGQQAPSRHGLFAHPLFRQAVHGLGHGARARRGYGRDVQDAVRREVRRGEHASSST